MSEVHQAENAAVPADNNPQQTDDQGIAALIELRKKCPRFRVLIIGKANAGKTTILQKMCNTSDAPIIHDQEGNTVDPSIIDPTDGRGIHDIDHELTFSSNPHFVFHDSAGFEANSSEEINKVRTFIASRATSMNLPSQLHAIWYCLPADNHRPLSKAEMTFFNTGTGKVPVIAIFTKFDGLDTKEYTKLREAGVSLREAKKLAPGLADKFFNESDYYLKKLEKVEYPPAAYLCLRDMHKKTTSCAELTQKTMEALSSQTLQFIFISVQQNNIQLCTEHAVKNHIMPRLLRLSQTLGSLQEKQMQDFILGIFMHYPHFWHATAYNDDDWRNLHRHWWDNLPLNLGPTLQAIFPSFAGLPLGVLPVLQISIAALVLAESSYWNMQEQPSRKPEEAMGLAVSNYEKGSGLTSIKVAVDKAFSWSKYRGIRPEEERDVSKKILEIVRSSVVVS